MSTEPLTGDLIIQESDVLAHFREYETQLAAFRERYAEAVYDLDDPKQNRQARSDRLAVGRVIADLDRRHKSLKEPLLAATRLVDGRRKEIKDALLDVQSHIKGQIEAHEQRERDRIAALDARVAEIYALAEPGSGVALTTAQWAERLEQCQAVTLGDDWEDRRAEAALAKAETTERVQYLLESTRRAEAEAAELERLRAERETRLRAEREEQIRREAAEQAKREAEAQAERERAAAAAAAEKDRLRAEAAHRSALEQEKREREQAERQAAAERAELERAKAAAEARAQRAAAEERARLERERREQEAAAAKAREADDRRKAAVKHRAKVHGEAKAGLVAAGLDEATATSVVEWIRDGDIAHVVIEY